MTERSINIWGPKWWSTMHLMSFTYPVKPTPKQKLTYTAAIQGIIQVLPCLDCRRHSEAYIQTKPPDVSSRSTLSKWMVEFHNNVNHRLGKKRLSYEKAQKLYLYDPSLKSKLQKDKTKCVPLIILSCVLMLVIIVTLILILKS